MKKVESPDGPASPLDPPLEASKIVVWLRNEAGRRGVPVLRSFERWISAVPNLRQRDSWTEINILIVDRTRGRAFNRRFRGRNNATNVLAFACEPVPGEHSGLLGDLVMCAPVVLREAREQGKTSRAHFAHLTIHGVLHLLGYDHANNREALRMEAVERQVLSCLGIADPYAA